MEDIIEEIIEDIFSWCDKDDMFYCKTSDESILIVMDHLKELDVVPPTCWLPSKNSDEARVYREKANNLLSYNCTVEQLQKACLLMTQSLAYASTFSNDLALAYAGRSTVLFRLRKYNECIEDIDKYLAINVVQDVNMQADILIRKTECLALTKSSKAWNAYKVACDWIKEHLEGIERARLMKKLEISYQKFGNKAKEKNLNENHVEAIFKNFKYTISSKEIPTSSDALVLRYNSYEGRHVVAAKDIKPGEIIAMEKPYCGIPHATRRYSQCWGCLSNIYNGVPCDHCPNVVFCSEKCRDKSWEEFHDIECKVLPSILNLEINDTEIVAIASLRMVILAAKESNSIDALMQEVEAVENCPDLRMKGFSDDGKFYSDKYRSVCGLLTNIEFLEHDEVIERGTLAIFITFYLATKTKFFGKIHDADLNQLFLEEEFVFIAALLFRNYQILANNGFTESEICNGKIREEGAVVLPFFSFLNHSCNPNVSRSNQNGHHILFALQPIRKGQQVYLSYGLNYFHTPLSLRQNLLNEQYAFYCKCIACNEQWPTMEYLPCINMFPMDTNVKNLLQKVMFKFLPYFNNSKSAMKMILDMPDCLKVLSETAELMIKHAPYPCREMNTITELIKIIFETSHTAFKKKNYLIY